MESFINVPNGLSIFTKGQYFVKLYKYFLALGNIKKEAINF